MHMSTVKVSQGLPDRPPQFTFEACWGFSCLCPRLGLTWLWKPQPFKCCSVWRELLYYTYEQFCHVSCRFVMKLYLTILIPVWLTPQQKLNSTTCTMLHSKSFDLLLSHFACLKKYLRQHLTFCQVVKGILCSWNTISSGLSFITCVICVCLLSLSFFLFSCYILVS